MRVRLTTVAATVAVAMALLMLSAPGVSAQTPGAVANPNTLTFTASVDHNLMSVIDGAPVLTRYEARVSLATDSVTLATLDLGKPTPDANNVITVTNALWFAGLTPKTKYVARVAAIGPAGEGVSDPSNPFGNAAPPAKTPAPSVAKK